MKLFVGLVVISLMVNHQPVLASETGWILTQRSKTFGDQYLYLSARGVKCINPRQGIGWITRAPQWNITFFNDKTKLYYPISYQSWKQKMAKHGLIPEDISWSRVGSGSIAGIKASHYAMKNLAQSPKTNKAQKWKTATYWLADEINVPSSLSQLISAACGLPASNSIPLQLSYCNQTGQSDILLTTYREQKTAISDVSFYLPASYKLANSEVEVLLSKENRALINELAGDPSHDNGGAGRSSMSRQFSGSNLKFDLPDQVTLPGGKKVSKGQINKFLDSLK